MILVLAAMRFEAAPFRNGLDSHAVAVGVTGIGGRAARFGAKTLIRRHDPELVLGVGLCGGLAPAARLGTVAVPEELRTDRAGSPIRIARMGAIEPQGCMVSAQRVASTPVEKGLLGADHQAEWVDQESFYWCEAAQAAGIRCLVVRVVLDPVGEYLPTWRRVASWRSALTLPARALYARRILADAGRRVLCELL